MTCGDSAFDLDLVQGRAEGTLTPDFWQQRLVDQRDFFLVSLLILLRQHDYFGIHANGIAHEDSGYLLVGDSGSGKTTLTLSLIQQGWTYIADDVILLHRASKCAEAASPDVKAQALRQGLACTSDTLTRFPTIASLFDDSYPLDERKRLVDVARIPDSHTATGCVPRFVLFPQIVDAATSQLAAISQAEALAILIRSSTGILVERAQVVAQMGLLQQLIQQTHCQRLLLGRDVYQRPDVAAALLSSVDQ